MPRPAGNDQSASAFRKAGVVMMFPSMRGGKGNPGVNESFLGEVDDILAAADFLAQQPHVDPKRICLGGHSTGGTLALLVAAATDRFRAVFSYGPVHDPASYGPQSIRFDARNPKELQLRAPMRWLAAVRTPTFVIEGQRDGNASALAVMKGVDKNPRIQYFVVQNADHFSVLEPTTAVLAKKVVADVDPAGAITLDLAELIGSGRRTAPARPAKATK